MGQINGGCNLSIKAAAKAQHPSASAEEEPHGKASTCDVHQWAGSCRPRHVVGGTGGPEVGLGDECSDRFQRRHAPAC